MFRIKLFGKTIFQFFDYYIMDLDFNSFNVYDDKRLTMNIINEENQFEIGNCIGDTTRDYLKKQKDKVKGYYFTDCNNRIIGSCWTMLAEGYDKTFSIKYDSYIFRVIVFKEYRGLGYSKEILSKTINELKKEKIKKTCLGVSVRNKIALNLYEKIGFKIRSRKVFFDIFGKIIPYYEI